MTDVILYQGAAPKEDVILRTSTSTAPLALSPAVEASGPTFTRTVLYPSILGSAYVLLTAVVAAQGPFAQADWQNPRGPQRAVELINEYSSGFLLPLTTVAPPFIQLDFPVPRGAKSNPYWIDTFKLPLQTLVPKNQFDWPVPRGPAPTQWRTWVGSFPLPLTTVEPNNQLDWPNPQGTRRNPDFVLGSPLALTSVVQAPFGQTEWPNPRGPTRSISLVDDTTWSFPLPLTTVVGSNQYDWPVPKGPQRANKLLTWLQTGFLEEAGAPFSETEWPNPRGAKPVVSDWVQSTPYALNAAVAAPFSETEWPNPRGAKSNPYWIDFFKLPLQSVTGFNQYDWPNPLRPHSNPDWIASTPQTILGSIQPFSETEWPNPRGAKPVVADWIYGTAYSLVSAVAPPFFETEWPNPRGAKPKVADWTDSFKLPLQTIVGANQHEWPNPRGPQWPIELRTWLQTGFLEEAAKPFAQLDWPVPRGAKPKVTDWQKSFDLPITTLVGSNQYDWPNPRGPRRPVADWTLSPPQPLTTTVVYPAAITFDYPNPTLRVATPRGFVDSFKLPLTTVRPNNQYQWPNPLPPRRITALGHTDRARPGAIPAAAPPVATRFWPNPVLPVVRRQDFVQRGFLQLQDVVPLQPIAGLKLLQRSLLVSTTGPNIVLGYPFPPPPEPVVPPLAKHGHGHTHTGGGQTALDASGSTGRTRSSRGTTSSRWRKSRGNIRTSRSKTTPRDDP